MTKLNQDFQLVAGDWKEIVVPVTKKEDGSVVNLTDATLRWIVSQRGRVLLEKTSIDGEILCPDPTTGILTIRVVKEDTISLPLGAYKHEVKMESGTGFVSTLLQGTLILL
jgi:hypothetical protein